MEQSLCQSLCFAALRCQPLKRASLHPSWLIRRSREGVKVDPHLLQGLGQQLMDANQLPDIQAGVHHPAMT